MDHKVALFKTRTQINHNNRMILSAADIADPFSFSDMKNAKFKLTEGDKVLLAMKTANLCSLVYSSTAVDGWKAGPVEEDGLRLLDISD